MKRAIVLTTLLVVGAAAMVAQPPPESSMAAAAKALMTTLDEAQLKKIRWPFESEERFNWHFVPRERQGLSFKEMTEPQRKAAMSLLRAGFGEKGYTKAETIRSLENVLRAIEGRAIRDPELYFFTIFGEPDSGTWGWRYEGHHISQNWTIVNGKAIATTPAFFGANPADVQDGPMKGTRALAAEEDLARALVTSLDEEQRKSAITSDKAPADILTFNTRKAAILENVGVAASQLSTKQQGVLMSLIEEHASAQSPALVAARLARVRADGLAAIKFAWLGTTEKGLGKPHYYRIQGPSFLIEYDNTQNNANHHHTVWRDFTGDFGVDLLQEHYEHDAYHVAQRQ
ncbi:MAG: DUF3500 domain-containing protein [Vicinamibacterales bacterium]